MLKLFKKIFGTAQTRILRRYRKILIEVKQFDEQWKSLTQQDLIHKTSEFKERFSKGETLESLLPEAFAVVKAACRLLWGTDIHVSGYDQKWDMIPYDEQILGAIALHYGSIAEMQTGEGKTLTAAMPLYLNALTGKPVHLVTVNDYLAKRDCEWIGTVFRFLGLTVNALIGNVPPHARKEIYRADIVYGTASEFGFDYLRDNSMAHYAHEQCQRGHFFAIIDEVDSILIDEARTPLIISGPSAVSRQQYDQLRNPVAQLVRSQRDLCNKLSNDAKKILEKLNCLNENEVPKLSKEEQEMAQEAYKLLWLVNKGTPQNKVLKRLKEHPDIRANLEKWETYYYADPNKEERSAALSQLYIIVDERSSEFELTDLGIQTWAENLGKESTDQEFLMLDLGHEYALIDENTELNEQEKLQRKIAIREEDAQRKERAHNLRQLLRAHLLMEKDVDYIVQEGKIVIIDENTGRPQPGRRFSDGLHQAIEAKESVAIQQETQTYATITLQNYFRMYDKLAGMTGTAMTEANEFKEIYTLEVLEIPTHKTCIRDDSDDEIYMTEREKYSALLKEIQEINGKGRPILIGTESVEISEKLSRILRQNKLEHTVLNAKNHEHEAEIISFAGKRGAITVATNMAGRGTDIKLETGVANLGGLHVIGTTRHQSRRIDRQLRGRSARQGDPGSSKFYVCFEDSLMRLFTSPKLTAFLQRFRPPEGEPISASILNKSIETAQKRVEQRNYSIRKHTLEYDDVMNRQRKEIYAFRNEILKSDKPIGIANELLEELCFEMADELLRGKQDRAGYRKWLMTHFPVSIPEEWESSHISALELEKNAAAVVMGALQYKLDYESGVIASVQQAAGKTIDPMSILVEVIRSILLGTIDRHWQEHLLHIDHLRTEVNLRVVGQKDPLQEFKHEAFMLFERFSKDLKIEICHALFKFQMKLPQPDLAPRASKRVNFDPFPTLLQKKSETLPTL